MEGLFMQERLAIFKGQKAVQCDAMDMFAWPIITAEDEYAVLEVLRKEICNSRHYSRNPSRYN
jgi:hypothetical protein